MRKLSLVFTIVLASAGLGYSADTGVSSAVVTTPADALTANAAKSPRVFVRGWEVLSAAAMRKPFLTQSNPDYKEGKRLGDRATDVPSARGQFLVVEIKYTWATLQPPTDPLWAGKPDVSIVDQNGAEFPAQGALVREGGVYATVGMTVARKQRNTPAALGKNNRVLVYFDVPATSQPVSLRLGQNGPVVPVAQVTDISAGDINLPK